MADDATRIRTPAQRCPEEFAALFEIAFTTKWPDGLKLSPAINRLEYVYRAASGQFSATLRSEEDLPDISRLKRPLIQLRKMVDAATDDLDAFSRLVGKNTAARGSLAGHAVLPLSIRNLFPCAALQEIGDWAGRIIADGGRVNAADLIARIEGTRPAKLGRKAMIAAADTMGVIGLGVSPDPRVALRAPRIGEPVILFTLPERDAPVEVSRAFEMLALRTGLAMMVAQADGVIHEAERAAIAALPGIDLLTPNERARLAATLRWMEEVPPEPALLRQRLKGLDAGATEVLIDLMIQIAGADGTVRPEEVAMIEKAYRLLGRDPGLLHADLHSSATREGPVTVRSAQQGAAGVPIPKEAPAGLGLDRARIAAVMADTADVSGLLRDVFAGEEPAAANSAPDIDGLDGPHAAFVRAVAEHVTLTVEALNALAASQGLMPGGAVETVNEWSWDAHGAPLLDEDDDWIVDTDIADALRPA